MNKNTYNYFFNIEDCKNTKEKLKIFKKIADIMNNLYKGVLKVRIEGDGRLEINLKEKFCWVDFERDLEIIAKKIKKSIELRYINTKTMEENIFKIEYKKD